MGWSVPHTAGAQREYSTPAQTHLQGQQPASCSWPQTRPAADAPAPRPARLRRSFCKSPLCRRCHRLPPPREEPLLARSRLLRADESLSSGQEGLRCAVVGPRRRQSGEVAVGAILVGGVPLDLSRSRRRRNRRPGLASRARVRCLAGGAPAAARTSAGCLVAAPSTCSHCSKQT